MLTFQALATVNREGKFRTAKTYGFLHLFKYSNHQLLIKDHSKGDADFTVAAEASDWYVWAGYQEKFSLGTYTTELTTIVNADDKSTTLTKLTYDNSKVETLVANNYVFPKECVNAPEFAAKLESKGWNNNVKQLTLHLTCKGAKAPETAPVKPEVAPVKPEVVPVKPEVVPVKPEVVPAKPEVVPVEAPRKSHGGNIRRSRINDEVIIQPVFDKDQKLVADVNQEELAKAGVVADQVQPVVQDNLNEAQLDEKLKAGVAQFIAPAIDQEEIAAAQLDEKLKAGVAQFIAPAIDQEEIAAVQQEEVVAEDEKLKAAQEEERVRLEQEALLAGNKQEKEVVQEIVQEEQRIIL